MHLVAYLPDGSGPVEVQVQGAVITRLAPCQAADDAAQRPGGRPVLCPGFIDLQVNGLEGMAFSSPQLEEEQVRRVTERLWREGVAGYCPTVTTGSFEGMARSLSVIAGACREPAVDRSVLGIHVEGPYLSPEDGPRGAHPREHIRPPDWDEFQRWQQAAEGRICLVTLAPELPGAIRFIRRAVEAGVRVAIGHTAASAEDIRRAIDAGACLATHLGNGAHDRLQRHRNYVYTQLAADELWASLIVDGHHLPPELVKIFVRAKGIDRSVLISDATQWAGMEPGVYRCGDAQIEVRADGWVGLVGRPWLAGSGRLLCAGVENVMQFAEVSLADAVRMASRNPAQVLGCLPQWGTLAAGSPATFSLADYDPAARSLTIVKTVIAGQVVFDRDGSAAGS